MESFMVKIIHWNCQLTKNKELPLIDNNKSYIPQKLKLVGKITSKD
jgi:hypothetical protein